MAPPKKLMWNIVVALASVGLNPLVTQTLGQSEAREDVYSRLAEFQIPSFVVTSGIDQTFERDNPVDRIILETHTTGNARTTGKVSSELVEARDAAIIKITIQGEVNSQTASKRGPATVNAKSQTEYTGIKYLEFLNGRVKHSPTEMQSTTSVTIGSVETTIPRWTGRIVIQVATNKAHACRKEVEQITNDLIRSELLSHIEKEFDSRITDLNDQIERQAAVLKAVSGKMFNFEINSKKHTLEVALQRRNRPIFNLGD